MDSFGSPGLSFSSVRWSHAHPDPPHYGYTEQQGFLLPWVWRVCPQGPSGGSRRLSTWPPSRATHGLLRGLALPEDTSDSSPEVPGKDSERPLPLGALTGLPLPSQIEMAVPVRGCLLWSFPSPKQTRPMPPGRWLLLQDTECGTTACSEGLWRTLGAGWPTPRCPVAVPQRCMAGRLHLMGPSPLSGSTASPTCWP